MDNFRFFTPDELKYWLEKTSFKNIISPVSAINYQFNQELLKRSIDYKLVFSISQNNITRFKNIFYNFLDDGCQQQIWEGSKYYLQNLEKKDFEFLQELCKTENHQVQGVEFVKFTYNFVKTPLLPTIFFMQTIKDVVEIIGNFWGFDESGQEVCNIKYPVGSIVSITNRSGDYFVESVEFVRKNTKKFMTIKPAYVFSQEMIVYHLLKMESSNSQVLEFSDSLITSSDFIKPNRTYRLDQLLN